VVVAMAYFADFFLRAGLFNTKAMEGSFLFGLIRVLTTPGMVIAEKIIHLQAGRWNLLLPLLGALTFVVRHFLLLVVEKMQIRATTR
jgi:hypothetical protein